MSASGTKVTWFGQSAFRIETPDGHVLYIDPWFENPMYADGGTELARIDRADLVLVTHGHFDHVGSAAAIARKTGARLVASLDLGMALARYGGFPKELMSYETLGNAGGVLPFFEGAVSIMITPAVHSSHCSAVETKAGDDDEYHWAGNASGFVIRVEGGPAIFHTGDTDLFGDLRYVSSHGPIDLMLTCIGDHFTMGPERAAEAAKLVDPRVVVPMHFGTFLPMMTGTPETFARALEEPANAIDAYGLGALGFTLEPGDFARWEASLERAVAEKKPVVLPLWKPYYLNDVYQLRVLDEPKGILGPANRVVLGARSDIDGCIDAPTVTALRSTGLTVDIVSELDRRVHIDGRSPDDVATEWVKNSATGLRTARATARSRRARRRA